MLQECIEGLNIKPDGVYVDATYGGGGHAKAILEKLERGYLIAFDQDPDAKLELIEHDQLIFVPANFRYIHSWIDYLGLGQVDGVLADLGVSSHQLDDADRGFSFRQSEQIDMRMNPESGRDIWSIINQSSASELQEILSRYGELRNARTLAQAIVRARKQQPIENAVRFNEIIENCVRGERNRYFAQVYQAFRIEVNDEMNALDEFLDSLSDVVKSDGRLVVMSYHSLEDRRVKNLIKKGNTSGKVEKDEYGNIYRDWEEVVKGVMRPSEEEIKENSRARSAKLRIAKRK
jgi:16S rRNA (cytosine1402-N4)-methyltransferase